MNAPKGYKAVPQEGCEGCEFQGDFDRCSAAPRCCSCHSESGCSVIYVKDEQATSVPAIVFYPAGSLGEPVESEGGHHD